MIIPGLEPGHPVTGLFALVLGILAVVKAAQHSRQAAMLTFGFVSAVFVAMALFVAIHGVHR